MNFFAIFRLIGLLLVLQGLTMLTPVYWALHFREDTVQALLMAAAVTVAAGGLLFAIGSQRRQEIYRREAMAVVGLFWIVAAAFGALPYSFTQSMPTFADCFFEAMSGFTTTGSSILKDIEALPKSVLFWRSLTHWLGGMGFVVLFIAILPILGSGGRHLYRSEKPGLIEDTMTPKIKQTSILLWKIYVALTVAETLLLMLASSKMTLFDALCHTFGTLATGGFSTKNLSIGYYNSMAVEIVVIFFMILGGINFSLHFRVWRDRGKLRAYWQDTEWRVYMGIIIAVTAIIAFQLYLTAKPDSRYTSLAWACRDSAFQTVSLLTTTGFCTVDFNYWPDGSKAILMFLLFVCGCSGSTAGGIKVIRWIVLMKIGHILFERAFQPRRVRRMRIGNTVIDQDMQIATLTFFFLWILIFAMASILIAFSGVDIITSATAVATTMANVGPGLNRVGPVDNFGFFASWVKYLLSLLMVMGRLELFSILVLFVPRFWRK